MKSFLRKIINVRLAACAAIMFASLMTQPAEASVKSPDQCVFTVTGEDAFGIYTGDLVCYDTFSEALAGAGMKNVAPNVTPQSLTTASLLSSGIIGIHYDSSNGTGASLTVNGTTCTGGGVNVPLSWNDVISSTLNGCGTITHYENTNFAGATFTTTGAGSLTAITGFMNNKTSSIRYFA